MGQFGFQRSWAALPLIAAFSAVLLSGCSNSLHRGKASTNPPVVAAPPPPAQPAPQEPVVTQGLGNILPGYQSQPGMVRAALLVPMTGPRANLGQAMSNAAQLAVFDAGGTSFNLLPVDTKGTPDGARQAVQTALSQGTELILGPLFSGEVAAIAPLAQSYNVPVVAFTTDQSVLGSGVYTLGILVQSQVQRVVSYAALQGKRNFGLLARSDGYGQTVAQAFQAAVQAAGGNVVKAEFYGPTQDLSAVAQRFVQGVNFDAIMIAEEGTKLRQVAGMLTYYIPDPAQVKFLGTLLWHDPQLRTEPALQGAWYAAPPSATHQAFQTRYGQTFGALAPRDGAIASVAYDATALAAVMAKKGDVSRMALEDPLGYAGVDGLFRLNANGSNERGLGIREIQGGNAVEIAPAPAFFGPGT